MPTAPSPSSAAGTVAAAAPRADATHRIDVVLPALDEAEALPWVLGRLPADCRAIVVDNGSSDGTAEVAAAHGATVVHEARRGFGAAAHAGLQAATADLVAFLDADGSLDPVELPKVTRPVLDGEADLVLGERHPTRGAWPWHAKVANRALALELRRRSGLPLRDLGPMRAARREDLLGLGLADRAFGYPLEMVLRAAQERWRVERVPVVYAPRRGGRSKVSGTAKGTARAIRDMGRLLR